MILQISFFELQKQFKQHGPDFVGKLQSQYGDIFRVKPPFLPPLYFVVDPQVNYELLVKQSPPLAKPKLIRRATRSSFGNGLFTSEGALWRSQRQLMQPVFHHGRIGRFAERMIHHTEQWLAARQDGEVIEIDTEMHTLTFTIVVDALFSTTGADTAVVAQALYDLGAGLNAQSKSVALTLLPEWSPLPALRQKQRGSQTLARLVQAMIAERRVIGEADSPPDLLSMLLFTRDAETGEHMSDQQIQDELVTLFIAGHETTAVLLAWIWVLLSKHPDTVIKLHEELARVLDGRVPTLADLLQLPITASIVKETLRLYPPAWFIFRELAEPITIEAGTMAAGSIVFMFPYTVQRDGRYFHNPTTFYPERWADGFERNLPKGAYFPFGMGSRICIGNGFASMEAQLLLAAIAQRFHLQAIDEAQIVSGVTTLGFAKSVRMRVNKR
ncbi:MAG: cytochrome P450 [Anaerolineae bacterium]|nr:cytochrome P450 [Anaerolineae bacterium]